MLGRKVTTSGLGARDSYWISDERPRDPDQKESGRLGGPELPPRRRLGHVAASGGLAGALLSAARPHALRGRDRVGVGPRVFRPDRARVGHGGHGGEGPPRPVAAR